MFTDPTTVTLAGTATPLPRISTGNMRAVYRNADGSLELEIAHTANKTERSLIRLRANKVGVDPMNSTRQKAYQAQAYVVIESPLNGVGFTDTELENHLKALTTFLTGTGVAAKILGKES